ncbi:MAG: lamin tail domain-containing protein [Ginsengibacter sp.]
MIRNLFSCFLMVILFTTASMAQLTENFSDGDFTNNPSWSGSTSDFIVNASSQLQSNNTVANSSYFLTTANTLATVAEWEMFVQLNFNPSSANYVDIYLIASNSDLTSAANTGYFVRIGNTNDELSLYRQDGGNSITKIIDGTDDVLNKSSNALKLKVSRDAGNQWILSGDFSGTGNAFVAEGSVIDATYTTTSFFGIFVKQSTASFFQKHFFDDIEIKNYVADVTPPVIQSATATSQNNVDLLFDEPVETTSAGSTSNYLANNNLGNPSTAIIDATNPALVHLGFATSFVSSVVYTLTVNGVSDLPGNSVNNVTTTFGYYTPQQYDVVIDEIMADPVPQVGLPNSEWIELKNTTSFAINLQSWKVADASGQSGGMPNFILQPDSFVIVCTGSAVSALSAFGKVISVTSFPALDNDGELIYLISPAGQTIHAVQYSSQWYQNELKKDGGWTLEMLDTKNPCGGISNWKASTDVKGGTPGQKNSADGANIDDTDPVLLRAFPVDNTTITLVFDEPLDSLKAATPGNYKIDNGITIMATAAIAPVFNKVTLTLSAPIGSGTVYTVTVSSVTDCKGNSIGAKNIAKFGIAQDADSLDIVINEILFNPKPVGVDYVELYNRSQKIIDLSHVYLANRNSSNAIASIQQISAESILFFPGDFIVLTSDPNAVKAQYITPNPDAFITMQSMPSFSDDKGNVIILNGQGNIIDELAYSDKWHFPLISNSEGVSLERIDYDGASIQSNFHSAATSVGYGTPGYKNSQYRLNEQVQGEIKISPEVFSPDNDGTDDFATIDYSFPAPGYVTNVTIFDANGRAVRSLQRNSLSGIKGYYRWDGLDDKNKKLPQGIYIIYTEIFNTDGKKKQFKNSIVLARRY